MEFRLAQKRMLFCAALFSFGTLSGALTMSELSAGLTEMMADRLVSAVFLHPYMLVPGTFILGPLLMIVFGLSPAGTFFVSLILLLCGFGVGALEALALRCFAFSPIPVSYALPYVLCSILIGSSMLRTASLFRAYLRSGGRLRPDFLSDLPRILCALAVMLLAAFCLTAYLVNA